MKFNPLIVVFFFLIIIGCDEQKDTNPPDIYITKPLDSSFVSEIVQIECFAEDDDSIKVVELWIDSLSTGQIDTTPPYDFLWNTVSLIDSKNYSISLMAEDLSNNMSFSETILLTVDNTNSHPLGLDIKTLTYTKTEMTIIIESSQDSDFLKYQILQSEGIESEKYLLNESYNISDTIIVLNDFNPIHASWYWVNVFDIHGYDAVGDGFFVLDSPPIQPTLDEIQFIDNSEVILLPMQFSIVWTMNNQNDFHSYTLYESDYSDMEEKIKIFETDDRTINNYNHEIEESNYKYYQLIVEDYWGLKTSSNIQRGCSWFIFYEQYENISYDYGRSLVQTDDGYVIAGNTSLFGDEYSDVLLLKIDQKGIEKWTQTYDFSSTDRLNFIEKLPDGSFIMTGSSLSSINQSNDILLMKTDYLGNIMWSKTFGTNQEEIAHSLDIASDGSFSIVFEVLTLDNGADIGLIKTDNQGDSLWTQFYGGNQNDYGYSILCTDDGHLISGVTKSAGDNNGDGMIIKTNSNGNLDWNYSYGGYGTEVFRSSQQTSDGGYIAVGHTNSYGAGNNDVFLLKINSNGDSLWSNVYGGAGTDQGRHVVQTINQGFAIFGYTDSYGELGGFNNWLLKVNSNGDLDWDRYYGGSSDDRGLYGIEASDGGYAITGFIRGSNNATDIMVIKTDNFGQLLD